MMMLQCLDTRAGHVCVVLSLISRPSSHDNMSHFLSPTHQVTTSKELLIDGQDGANIAMHDEKLSGHK